MPLQLSGPRALCRQTALYLGSNVQRGCLRRLVVWWWKFFRWCIRFSLGCDADEWKYTIIYFLYQEDVGSVCMLNVWFCSIDEICPDNYNYSSSC